jgi:hypothetical protein
MKADTPINITGEEGGLELNVNETYNVIMGAKVVGDSYAINKLLYDTIMLYVHQKGKKNDNPIKHVVNALDMFCRAIDIYTELVCDINLFNVNTVIGEQKKLTLEVIEGVRMGIKPQPRATFMDSQTFQGFYRASIYGMKIHLQEETS